MRVLLVEDNVDAANSLALVLRLWGFDAEVAYDAATALTLATATHPDVILTDLGLPDMDGFELARRLTNMPEVKDALLAALSAYNDDESIERAHRSGMVRHFVKPADLVALHRFLDNRREQLHEH